MGWRGGRVKRGVRGVGEGVKKGGEGLKKKRWTELGSFERGLKVFGGFWVKVDKKVKRGQKVKKKEGQKENQSNWGYF